MNPNKMDKNRLRLIWVGLLFSMTSLIIAACGSEASEPRVFFAEPQNGAEVKSPFRVVMGSEGLVLEPAGDQTDNHELHGHHHIIVDSPLPGLDSPIPENSVQHLHFGKAQTETVLDLPAGNHTLRLLFAKADHVPWQPPFTDIIEITVVD